MRGWGAGLFSAWTSLLVSVVEVGVRHLKFQTAIIILVALLVAAVAGKSSNRTLRGDARVKCEATAASSDADGYPVLLAFLSHHATHRLSFGVSGITRF
jgi:hypothetical protein